MRPFSTSSTLGAKRHEIELVENGLIEIRQAADLADQNYQGGGVSLPIYLETQKQYLELVALGHDLQKDALQAAQELEVLTGLKLYTGAQER